jgi:Zn-finger nucleic acid-binding protein
MKCPCCTHQLQIVRSGKLQLDGCTNGCGGLWFDAGELEKVDEGHEGIAKELFRLVAHANVVIDREKERNCPKCSAVALDRHCYDGAYHLEVDLCDGCGGCWLDMGELAEVRDQNDLRNAALEAQQEFLAKLSHDKDGRIRERVAAVLKLIF